MTLEEFMNEIKQVKNFYDKKLSDEQKQIWFKELRNIGFQRFQYIISNVYKTSKFLPKLADIIELNSNLAYSQTKEPNKNCSKCNNTGYVVYKKAIDNGIAGKIISEYGAICECKQKPKYEGWKITDEAHRTNYYIPHIEEIGG